MFKDGRCYDGSLLTTTSRNSSFILRNWPTNRDTISFSKLCLLHEFLISETNEICLSWVIIYDLRQKWAWL
jgi:hypothetical protein